MVKLFSRLNKLLRIAVLAVVDRISVCCAGWFDNNCISSIKIMSACVHLKLGDSFVSAD